MTYESPFKKLNQKPHNGGIPQDIVNSLHALPIMARFLHHNTKSYAKHMATGMVYDSLSELNDDILEKAMGCTGSNYQSITLPIISGYSDEKCYELAEEIKMFAQRLKSWADEYGYLDISQQADTINGVGAKFAYLLTLS